MTKLTVRHNLPGFHNLRDPVYGQSHSADPVVFVDGVQIDRAVTVDTDRGFVDYRPKPLVVFAGRGIVHRIFGKVHLKWPTQT